METKPTWEVDEALFEQAAQKIKEADAVLVTAGAGMSVDSGMPDYRGTEGLWKCYPPLKHLNMSLSDVSDPETIASNPHLVWGFHGHRMKLYKDATPHEGYQMIRRWGDKKKHGYFAVTSNVDAHFTKAGFPEERLYEVHGNFRYLQCEKYCQGHTWYCTDELIDSLEIDLSECKAKDFPKCPHCGRTARVNALLFGDDDWVPHRYDKQRKSFNRWVNAIQEEGDKLAIIEIGAGTAIPTIRRYGEATAVSTDATLIRVNIREPQIPVKGNHIGLPCGGLYALEKIQHYLDKSD